MVFLLGTSGWHPHRDFFLKFFSFGRFFSRESSFRIPLSYYMENYPFCCLTTITLSFIINFQVVDLFPTSMVGSPFFQPPWLVILFPNLHGWWSFSNLHGWWSISNLYGWWYFLPTSMVGNPFQTSMVDDMFLTFVLLIFSHLWVYRSFTNLHGCLYFSNLQVVNLFSKLRVFDIFTTSGLLIFFHPSCWWFVSNLHVDDLFPTIMSFLTNSWW